MPEFSEALIALDKVTSDYSVYFKNPKCRNNLGLYEI